MVADGEYREGCKNDLGLANRVWLGGSYWKRLRSENGASKTFIFGAPGSGTDGIGADAMRCVYADSYALVQGFTLLDGHSNDGSDADAMRGGGMYSSLNTYAGTGTYHDQFVGIADCVISNCVASRGAAIFGGFAYRCLITGNRAVNNGITRNCVICTSLVTRNEDVASKGVIGTLSTLYQTTVADNCTSNGVVSFQDLPGGWHTNAVFSSIVASTRGGNDITRQKSYVTNSDVGTSYYGKTSTMSADTVIGDPKFRNPSDGDFHVVLSSPAVKLGDPEYFKTALDFTGRPYTFDENGRYVVGAFAQPVESRQLYVDDVNGNDGNSGLAWDSAKKTLAAAAALMIPGDTLNVAPGVYNAGSMLQEYTSCPLANLSWTPAIQSRLVVPAGCSVVSRDGSETTFIVGAADGTGDADGFGPNAIRGVFLGPDTKLSGFTVAGGRTDS